MEVVVVLALVLEFLIAVALVVAVVGYLARRSGRDTGSALRSLFRYGFLLVLMLLVGTGVTGLVAIGDPDVAAGPGYTAFMLACVIVGGPGLLLVSRWVRRALDRSGGTDAGWEIYLVVSELVSLLTAGAGAYLWAESLTEGRFRLLPLAAAVVWGVIWSVHHTLAGRLGRTERLGVGVLLGSAAGLVTASVFGVLFLEGVVGRIYDLVAGAAVIAETARPIPSAVVGVVIWGAVWLRYWWFIGIHGRRSVIWRAYVLLVGVVGGLFAALAGVWNLAYRILDWMVGDSGDPARLHFEELPPALALVAVGGLVWRYHRAVLGSPTAEGRTEVDRVHHYTVAGAGLIATVGGLGAVIAAGVQALIPAGLAFPSDRSDLVAAVTVLLTGGPLWWRYWTSVQRWRHTDPDAELRSPTRRIYLICVFGAGGVLALGSLFVLAYRILEALLEGGPDTATVFAIRRPLALALTVGIAAVYHRAIRRVDVIQAPEEPPARTVRSVILVGSPDSDVAASVRERTGIEVRVWTRPDIEDGDDVGGPLSTEMVVGAIESAGHEHLLILAGPEGTEVIPYTEE